MAIDPWELLTSDMSNKNYPGLQKDVATCVSPPPTLSNLSTQRRYTTSVDAPPLPRGRSAINQVDAITPPLPPPRAPQRLCPGNVGLQGQSPMTTINTICGIRYRECTTPQQGPAPAPPPLSSVVTLHPPLTPRSAMLTYCLIAWPAAAAERATHSGAVVVERRARHVPLLVRAIEHVVLRGGSGGAVSVHHGRYHPPVHLA